MEKKIKTGRIIDIYATLNGAKYTKMESADRRRLFTAQYAMKKIVTENDAMQKEAVEKFKPEGYDEKIAPMVEKFNAMAPEERAASLKNDREMADAIKSHTEFVGEVNGVIMEARDKEIERVFTPLSEETFDKLLDSNPDWTVGVAVELHEILCEAKEETAAGEVEAEAGKEG